VGLLLHLRYIADLVIRAAPLSTGLAADVHGQVSFLIVTCHTLMLGSWFHFFFEPVLCYICSSKPWVSF